MVQLPESKQVSSGVVPGVDAWEGGMQVQDVTFTYPPRGQEVPGQGVADPAVRGVSLDLQIGSTTALVGKSGSGKSTLVQLLTRQVDPDSGRIALAGRSLTELDSAWFRSCIAIVPQVCFLCMLVFAAQAMLARHAQVLKRACLPGCSLETVPVFCYVQRELFNVPPSMQVFTT